MTFTNTSKGAAFIVLVLIMLCGVADGVAEVDAFDVVNSLQFVAFALVGFASMIIGLSYAQEVDA